MDYIVEQRRQELIQQMLSKQCYLLNPSGYYIRLDELNNMTFEQVLKEYNKMDQQGEHKQGEREQGEREGREMLEDAREQERFRENIKRDVTMSLPEHLQRRVQELHELRLNVQRRERELQSSSSTSSVQQYLKKSLEEIETDDEDDEKHEFNTNVKRFKFQKIENCCICMSDFKKGEEVGQFDQCEHIFHNTCLHTWLQKKKDCPICRKQLI